MADQRPILGPEPATQRYEPGTVGSRQISPPVSASGERRLSEKSLTNGHIANSQRVRFTRQPFFKRVPAVRIILKLSVAATVEAWDQ